MKQHSFPETSAIPTTVLLHSLAELGFWTRKTRKGRSQQKSLFKNIEVAAEETY